MDIDDLIRNNSPYPVPQAKNMSTETQLLSRIPLLMDPQTGEMNPKFQEFYENVVKALKKRDIRKLYHCSDLTVDKETFSKLVDDSGIFREIENLETFHILGRNLDVEVDVSKFQGPFRNIICGFIVSYYTIELKQDEDRCWSVLKQRTTELLFTYIDHEFMLITKFMPFQNYSEESL